MVSRALALALVALAAACAAPLPVPDARADDAQADAPAAADSESAPDAPACGNASQRDCYSGPAATRNVGACRAGVQRCFGGEWGPCVGEATPGDELCGNGTDDDCNGVIDCPTDAGLEAGDASPPCVDFDRDGYGVGAGCMGPDCNDDAADTHPGAEERCDGRDNNCDGRTDDASEAAALDAYCRRTAAPVVGVPWTTPPICRVPGRMVSSAYSITPTRHACQVCRSGSGPFVCECWTGDGSFGVCR